jgi:putative peptide zinc metalloprotease protein
MRPEERYGMGLAAPLRLAEGTELLGEYEGSGLKQSIYLIRRADGQVLQLSPLLYLITSAVDGQCDFVEIAQEVSQEFGRHVSAENVRFLVEGKLSALGILVREEEGETHESAEPSRLDEAVLGLRYKVGLISPQEVSFITAPFLFLFRMPVMVFVLVGLIGVDVWLFFHGIVRGMQEIIYQPALVLAFFVLETLAMGWHECGHASACRYGGAKPGVVGAGIYVFWFVFYSDVTDSYRLS